MANRNSLKLAQIIRLKAILLSGKFQENRIVGSSDICLGTIANHRFGDNITKSVVCNGTKAYI